MYKVYEFRKYGKTVRYASESFLACHDWMTNNNRIIKLYGLPYTRFTIEYEGR